jgi:hypothetical protein
VFVAVRADGRSGSSAARGTRRRVESTAEEVGESATGLVVVILGTAAALAGTFIGSLEIFGDILAQFAGEAALLFVTLLGYLGIGGSIPGDGLVPSLTPTQFVAIALLFGGLAIAFRR